MAIAQRPEALPRAIRSLVSFLLVAWPYLVFVVYIPTVLMIKGNPPAQTLAEHFGLVVAGTFFGLSCLPFAMLLHWGMLLGRSCEHMPDGLQSFVEQIFDNLGLGIIVFAPTVLICFSAWTLKSAVS